MFEWILTAVSLLGNYLNCRKIRVCFAIWIVVNVCWAVLDFQRGAYSRTLLDLVQTAFCVYGLKEWERV